MEVGRILSRSRRAVKFRPLNGHSSRVRGKTWLSPLVVPSSCAFHPAAAAAAAAAAGGGGGRGEAGTKVLGAKRWVVAEEGENKGSGAEYFNIYHGEIGTRVCRGSLLPRHFPPPPCSSSTPRLANRRLRCPTARSDSPLSTPPPSPVLIPRDMFIRPADYACYTMVRKNGRKGMANLFLFRFFFHSSLSLSSYFSLSHLLILIDERDLVALFRGKKKRCNDKFRFPSSSHSFPSNVISLIPLTVNLFLLQYGSDEFGQDSPRYTSPKAAALYADPYYIGKSRFHTLRNAICIS